jgi:hypothetical protein
MQLRRLFICTYISKNQTQFTLQINLRHLYAHGHTIKSQLSEIILLHAIAC